MLLSHASAPESAYVHFKSTDISYQKVRMDETETLLLSLVQLSIRRILLLMFWRVKKCFRNFFAYGFAIFRHAHRQRSMPFHQITFSHSLNVILAHSR